MAESKSRGFSTAKESAAKTSPIHISRLSPEAQQALYRSVDALYRGRTSDTDRLVTSEVQAGDGPYRQATYETGRVSGKGRAPLSDWTQIQSPEADAALLKKEGVAGRIVLSNDSVVGDRLAFSVDNDGRAVVDAARGERGGQPYSSVVGQREGYVLKGDLPVQGARSISRDGGTVVSPAASKKPSGILTQMRSEGNYARPFVERPTSAQVTAALDKAFKGSKGSSGSNKLLMLDVGQALYQFLNTDVDTDFTIKMIPPRFRTPDETGKIREAIAVINGEPIRLYEGEAWRVPGFEDIGDDLAAYFRENSALSAGKNKLGSDVGESGMEVRQSDEQALRKRVEAGVREAAKSTGPAKGGTPMFESEYQVGSASRDPGVVPSSFTDTRRLLKEMGAKADQK